MVSFIELYNISINMTYLQIAFRDKYLLLIQNLVHSLLSCKMSSTALTAISVAVGVFFVFFGTLKLGPLFSDELYRSVRKNFIRMFKTFPFSSFTGWNPNPHVIRRVYGTTEVVGGIVLAACSGTAQDVSNVILLSLMLFHLFSIWRVADGLKEASNLIVLCLMLTCRFIIRIQTFQSRLVLHTTYISKHT
ncbi:unnamed protein product [Schistosoma bovis]|nr:unnamed protein product [Schistosoma bovis]